MSEGSRQPNNTVTASNYKRCIRAFPSDMDEKFVAQTLATLERAIQEILRKNNPGLSFEELYRNAYNIVLHKHGERLYIGLKKVVTDHLNMYVAPIVAEAIPNNQLLVVLIEKWHDHTTAMKEIQKILAYMDRIYVVQQNMESVYSLGLLIFREVILQQQSVNEHLRTTLLQLIAAGRNGDTINWDGIRDVCNMLVDLGINCVYVREFEEPFLKETEIYYVQMAQKFLEQRNASTYLKKIEECIDYEAIIAKKYLGPETESKVLKVLDNVLITSHMQTIVDMDSGVKHMLANNMIDDLRRMYKLLSRVDNGLQTISTALSRYLKGLGEAIESETGKLTNNAVKYIQSLLELKDKCDLKETEIYYVQMAQKFLEQRNASIYLKEVEKCIDNEAIRARKYLDPETESKVLEVLDNVLITSHMQTIVDMDNSGVEYMLANDMIDDLRRMYKLLRRVDNGLQTISTALSRYLKGLGEAIVSETGELANNAVKYIQSLLELKDKCDHYLTDAFSNDKLFKNRIQDDFQCFFNTNANSPEYLSLYMDDKLRKGIRVIGDAEIECYLDKSMVLFRFLQEKDVFEKFYKQHLAKRLLLDKSISDDSEKAMLSKLKTECGCQFTQKLENMFRDKELWNNLSIGYKDYKDSNQLARTHDPVDISVRVLTARIWPTQTSTAQCILPQVCINVFKTFEDYYTQKYSGKKITVNTLLGNADVRAIFYGPPGEDASQQEETIRNKITPAFLRREKILQTNTHTMVLLMRFNTKSKMTFDELLVETQIPEKELKRTLQSLAMGKLSQRILCRKGKGKEIEPSDEFYVNDSFTSKQICIKIQLFTTKNDVEPERKDVRSKIDEDRKHEVEAAIVRIMKSRKVMPHNNLITEVTTQLKHCFTAQPVFINKRIESLVEREYLARDQNDQKVYTYVA